jgi:hypothetical protein
MTDNYRSDCDKLFPQSPVFCTRCIYNKVLCNIQAVPVGATCMKTGLSWRSE